MKKFSESADFQQNLSRSIREFLPEGKSEFEMAKLIAALADFTVHVEESNKEKIEKQYKDQIETLKKQRDEMVADLEDTARELDDKVEKCYELKIELEDCEADLKEEKELNEHKGRVIQNLIRVRDDLTKENITFSHKVREIENDRLDIERSLGYRDKAIEILNKSNQDLEEELETLKRREQALIKDRNTFIKENNDLDIKVRELEEEIAESRDYFKNFLAKNEALLKEIHDMCIGHGVKCVTKGVTWEEDEIGDLDSLNDLFGDE